MVCGFGDMLGGLRVDEARAFSLHSVHSPPLVDHAYAHMCARRGMPRTHRPWRKILVMVEGISLLDAYTGKPLAEGERNLAYSLTFRRGDRTLSDEEVEGAMERIRSRLREDLGARIRE